MRRAKHTSAMRRRAKKAVCRVCEICPVPEGSRQPRCPHSEYRGALGRPFAFACPFEASIVSLFPTISPISLRQPRSLLSSPTSVQSTYIEPHTRTLYIHITTSHLPHCPLVSAVCERPQEWEPRWATKLTRHCPPAPAQKGHQLRTQIEQ